MIEKLKAYLQEHNFQALRKKEDRTPYEDKLLIIWAKQRFARERAR